MGPPLRREDGPVMYSYKCYWALPGESLSGPSPAGLVTVSFETRFISVAPYYSQNYGGGIVTLLQARTPPQHYILPDYETSARTS
jgi:hypothetical protein